MCVLGHHIQFTSERDSFNAYEYHFQDTDSFVFRNMCSVLELNIIFVTKWNENCLFVFKVLCFKKIQFDLLQLKWDFLSVNSVEIILHCRVWNKFSIGNVHTKTMKKKCRIEFRIQSKKVDANNIWTGGLKTYSNFKWYLHFT